MKDTVALVFLHNFCRGAYKSTFLRVDNIVTGLDDKMNNTGIGPLAARKLGDVNSDKDWLDIPMRFAF